MRTGDRARLAQYGNPLTLIGSLARGALCASPGHEFLIFDYSSIESRVLAWLAGETWKLNAYREFDSTGDKRIEPYRIVASSDAGQRSRRHHQRSIARPARAAISPPASAARSAPGAA